MARLIYNLDDKFIFFDDKSLGVIVHITDYYTRTNKRKNYYTIKFINGTHKGMYAGFFGGQLRRLAKKVTNNTLAELLYL